MTDAEPRIPIDRETAMPWVEVAHSARLARLLLSQVKPPVTGSPFAQVDEYVPTDRVSTWCRSYLTAAIEHLRYWADLTAPLKFHPDAVVEHSLRPAQTLARAALESASQAVWVMAGGNTRETLRRHLVLVLHDWDEQRKAAIDASEKARIKSESQALRDELIGNGLTPKQLLAPSYLELVTSAAQETARGTNQAYDGADVERLWRASAGSAHGKRWPSIELSIDVTASDGLRTVKVPNPEALTRILKLADEVTQYGVARYTDYCGQIDTIDVRMRKAFTELWATAPLLPGAEPPNYPDVINALRNGDDGDEGA